MIFSKLNIVLMEESLKKLNNIETGENRMDGRKKDSERGETKLLKSSC